MEWASDQGVSSAPEFFFATMSGGERRVALGEMWRFFASTVVAANRDVRWDVVRVEIWADTGRVLVFLSNVAFDKRIEKAGLCLIIPALQVRYEKLERLDEELFEAALTTEIKELADDILATARSARMVQGLPSSPIPVEVWETEEDAPTAIGSI